MIIGSVNADYEPVIVLRICGADAKVLLASFFFENTQYSDN